MQMRGHNKRPAADAGWRVLFAFGHPRPRAAQAGCCSTKVNPSQRQAFSASNRA